MMQSNKRPRLSESVDDCSSILLKDVVVLILETGIGKARTDLFRCKVRQLGGTVTECLGSDTEGNRPSHLIVDDKMTIDRLLRILKVTNISQLKDVKIVQSAWLSQCIKTNQLTETQSYELSVSGLSSATKVATTSSDSCIVMLSPSTMNEMRSCETKNCFSDNKQKDSAVINSDCQSCCSDEDHDLGSESTHADSSVAHERLLPRGNWVCAASSFNQKINKNQLITDKLEAMATTYESINDKWRALSYRKAIIAIKKHNKDITSFDEAKSIPGVGVRLAEKIWEIAESGDLQKLKELTSQDEIKALEVFTNVWGAGVHSARAWVQRGYRCLDDLRADDVGLTRNQQIGLKYYDEFLERMDRDEAGKIEAQVKEMALSIQPGLTVMACGSYRRGKKSCGDVDILITHSDGHSHGGVFAKLISRLTDSGFLTDDLVVSQVESTHEHRKYLGVCRLPGSDSKHRRLDIIVVPYSEFACASLYFTGSAHFNRSMRNLAARLNMSLNEHGLYSGVVRTKGVPVHQGVLLNTPTEQSIFAHLGLTYLSPEERDH